MSEKYYRVRTAAKLIDSEFSSRTLYSWIAKIEKRTTYRFLRKDILRNGERKDLTAAIFATFLSPEELAERLMIEENIL